MAKKPLRIIPRLDIKGPNLVKGVKLEGLRVLGNPELFAEHYFNDGADEFFFQDIVASLYDRNNLSDIVNIVAEKVFIPLTVGGGIRKIIDIENILRAGADKVSINTAAIKNPNFIKEASEAFGSSTICISIECSKIANQWIATFDNGRERSNYHILDWVKQIQDLGAGEIVLTNVNREGTAMGTDQDLLALVCNEINVPFIYHGGINTVEDIKICQDAGCDGVAIASILHYQICKSLGSTRSSEGNYKFIDENLDTPTLVQISSIKQLKKLLQKRDVPIRL